MKVEIRRWSNPYPPNPAMLREIMAGEGDRVFQWSDRLKAVYGMHKHNEDQSHRIISGIFELTLQSGESYILEADDRDFLPANTYHSVCVIGEDTVLHLIGEKIK